MAADEFDPPPPPSIVVPGRPKGATCGALRNAWDPATGERLRCKQRAGFGTDHLGYGQCKTHGGNAPGPSKGGAKLRVQHVVESVREQLGAFYGLSAVLPYATPVEVLSEELNRCRGVVAWIEQRISRWSYDADFDSANGGGGVVRQASVSPGGELVEALTVENDSTHYSRLPELRMTDLPPLLTVVRGEKSDTITESEFQAWIKQLGVERDRLRTTAKLCIDADLDGRMVRLHEAGGLVIVQTLQLVLTRMGITGRQRELEALVPEALTEVQGQLVTAR